MALHVRTVAKTGKVEVTIDIAQLQMATYTFAVRNADGSNRREIGQGDNANDKEPDQFPVAGSGTSLRDKFLVYWITLAAPVTAPGQRYTAVLQILQAGKPAGDPIVESGPIEHSANAIGAVKFEIV